VRGRHGWREESAEESSELEPDLDQAAFAVDLDGEVEAPVLLGLRPATSQMRVRRDDLVVLAFQSPRPRNWSPASPASRANPPNGS
jgi:hypothetical protein